MEESASGQGRPGKMRRVSMGAGFGLVEGRDSDWQRGRIRVHKGAGFGLAEGQDHYGY